MLAVHPEFIVDGKAHKKAVVVPYVEWQQLMEEIEELEDIRSYDKAKAKSEKIIPFEDAIRQIRRTVKK